MKNGRGTNSPIASVSCAWEYFVLQESAKELWKIYAEHQRLQFDSLVRKVQSRALLGLKHSWTLSRDSSIRAAEWKFRG